MQEKTKILMLKIDGHSKHERFFSVNPVDKSISWSERPDGKKAKTERLSSATDSITACSVKPKYADRDFTIGTEENTQLLLVAETVQQKQLWVDGCQAVINGQITSAPRIGEALNRAVSSQRAMDTTPSAMVPVSVAPPELEPEPEPEFQDDQQLGLEPDRVDPELHAGAPVAPPNRNVSFAGGPALVESMRLDSTALEPPASDQPRASELGLASPDRVVDPMYTADGVLDLTRGFSDGPLDDGLGPSPRPVEDSLFGQPVGSVRHPKAAQYKFLPAAIHELTSWLQANAASVPGLFSRESYEDRADPGVALLSSQLDEDIHGATLYHGQQPQTVAGVLKAWLREMPEPLLTTQFFDEWVETSNATTREECVEGVTRLVAKLPLANCEILSHLTKFLNEYSNASDTPERDIAEEYGSAALVV